MNPVLETRATSVEGILFWSYGVSNRSGYHSPQLSDEISGRSSLRIDDLKVEAAMIQSEVNRSLQWPHLRAIVEAKYGERQEAVMTCAEILRKTARTQTLPQLVRIVESYIEWHRLSVEGTATLLCMSAWKSATARTRYEGILEGWHRLALDVIEDSFRMKGWIA